MKRIVSNLSFGDVGRRYFVSISTPVGRRSVAISIAIVGMMCYASEVPRLAQAGLGVLGVGAIYAVWSKRA